MPQSSLTVNDIREEVEKYLNCYVRIEAHRSKKKVYQKEGVIREVYSNIFVIDSSDTDGPNARLSFTYIDLLTQSVKLVLLENDKETDLFAE